MERKSTMNTHWKDWCWSWSSSNLATWCKDPTHQKRPWCWERLKAGEEGGNRGWDGWMASRTQWTWVWANSRRYWRKGKPGVLQSMGSQSQTQLSNWTRPPMEIISTETSYWPCLTTPFWQPSSSRRGNRRQSYHRRSCWRARCWRRRSPRWSFHACAPPAWSPGWCRYSHTWSPLWGGKNGCVKWPCTEDGIWRGPGLC